MHTLLSRAALFSVLTFVACKGKDDTDDTDTDTDTDADTDTDTVTTFAAVNAIFNQKCSPCHVTDGFGGHNMGSTDVTAAYADSQLGSSQPGITLGAWALNRIQFGAMPLARGCSGDPAADVSNPDCLTQAQQDTVQDWIADGQLP